VLFLEARSDGWAERWPLRGESFVLGRGAQADILLDDETISRRHLRLTLVDGERIAVEDLGSTNGLRVDGERVARIELPVDRWFVAGNVMLAVRKGLSLTSRLDLHEDGEPSRRGRSADSPTASGRGMLTPPSPAEDRPTQTLLAALERARGPEEALAAVLEEARQLTGAAAVHLVERIDGRWSLRAAAGSTLPAAPERELLAAAESVDDGEARWQDGVLAHPAPPCGGGEGGWLLLHPWPDAREVPFRLRLLVALCGLCLGRHGEVEADLPDENADTRPASAPSTFVYVSALCRDLIAQVDRLAGATLPVLLCGESGTGKELLARRLHDRSPRRAGPFVALNCAALPRELLEAELFGIERGVATGVQARPGRFQLAAGGTLLLDEVADLPPELQPKLLRALEAGEILPLGASAPIRVDVRVVSATHEDLAARVVERRFRRDLFHRIAGATVEVPPLRERPEDILPLAREFARRAAAEQSRRALCLDLEMARELLGYAWPGNVRELQHVISRAVALADGPFLHAALLPRELRTATDLLQGSAVLGLDEEYRVARRHFERLYFARLVERCAGNLSEASRIAGLTRSHLYRKLEDLDLRD
jgi:DNA-binding NtrC family response regulator